jgi:hypothetical protein
MQKYTNNVQTINGKAIANAQVTVNILNAGVATLYSDNSGTPLANPVITDPYGVFSFYAEDGRYTLSILAGGVTTTVTDILLEDPLDGSPAAFSDITVDSITVDGVDLSASNGSSAIGFLQAGTDAVATNVQTKLRNFPSSSDYSTNADYMAAVDALSTGKQYVSEGVKITRIPDRLFVGNAATSYAGGPSPDAGTSWLGSASEGPHYLLSNATFIAMPETRRYGIIGAAKTDLPLGGGSAIGMGSIIINDATGADAVPGWGYIVEAQHETVDSTTWGIEVAIKNASGGVTTVNPFSTTGTNKTYGIQLSGGGDNAFGPAATNPCTAGVVFSTNNGMGFNSGIVFFSGSVPTNNAIELPYNYRMAWYDSMGGQSAIISSTNNTPSTQMRFNIGPNNFNFMNNAGKTVFYISTSATAVNRVQITAGDTGVHPQITVEGDDANLDIRLIPKGTGAIRFGSWISNADTAITGYITIKDSVGTTRKLATIA